jgi:uncharacterized protein YndB with AHSA1/START domain
MADTGLQLTKPPEIKAQMLIRRPISDVFEAFVNPEITTKFWFTKASAPLETGKTVVWEWEMYGVSAEVLVQDVQSNSRILIDWGGQQGGFTTVEWNFVPYGDTTFVTVSECGYAGAADEMVARAIDSMGGFSLVLAAAKAWLEHGVTLAVVADHAPPKRSDPDNT